MLKFGPLIMKINDPDEPNALRSLQIQTDDPFMNQLRNPNTKIKYIVISSLIFHIKG